VRNRPSGACPDCGTSWPATARYCGRCGSALTVPPAHTATRGPAGWRLRPGPRRAVRAAAVGVLVVGVVAAVVQGAGPWPGAATSALDDEVALPSAASVPPAASAALATDTGANADDATDAASARTRPRLDRADVVLSRHQARTPRSVGCVPAGCEAWRRPLDRERPPTVASGDGLVVVVEADRATALDAASGTERWVAPLDDLLPTTADGTRLSDLVGRDRPEVVIDGDLVLVGTLRRVAALEATDGSRRWVARSTGWRLEELTPLAEVVVLRGRPVRTDVQDDAGLRRQEVPVIALDRTDGTVRWTTDERSRSRPRARTAATELIDVAEDGITAVVRGDLRGHDPATGWVRWRRSWTAGAYAFRAGPWLVTEGSGGHRLLDPASGQEVADLDGYLAHGVLEVDDVMVSVLLRPEASAAGATSHPADLVALAADGSTVWRERYGFAAPMRCCATLLPWEEGVAVLGLRGERELRELATGERLSFGQRLPLDGPAQVAPDGTLVGEPVADLGGVPATSIVTPDGRVTHVAGPELAIVGTDPLVVRGSGELVGVRPAGAE
jgi:outer membrane protein assembly factor BamB